MTPIQTLVSSQNGDGGWPYVRGSSWTEPTVFCVLAALAAEDRRAAERGAEWLRKLERPGGGWAPQAGVEEATWVTALVALVPSDLLGGEVHHRAIEWLLKTTGEESSALYRLRAWMLGESGVARQSFHGWPWFPGNGAWVAPTVFSLLALLKEMKRQSSPSIAGRIESGRAYLLARTCRDGGWNHGSTRALGYDSGAYPESTGLALMAFAGVENPMIEKAVLLAQKFLASCHSSDGQSWLRLGLMAHGRLPTSSLSQIYPARTLRDSALAILTDIESQGRGGLL
jgi:hypothetical protein